MSPATEHETTKTKHLTCERGHDWDGRICPWCRLADQKTELLGRINEACRERDTAQQETEALKSAIGDSLEALGYDRDDWKTPTEAVEYVRTRADDLRASGLLNEAQVPQGQATLNQTEGQVFISRLRQFVEWVREAEQDLAGLLEGEPEVDGSTFVRAERCLRRYREELRQEENRAENRALALSEIFVLCGRDDEWGTTGQVVAVVRERLRAPQPPEPRGGIILRLPPVRLNPEQIREALARAAEKGSNPDLGTQYAVALKVCQILEPLV